MSTFYIKANRIFSPIRKYGWIFTLLVAIGGLWFPKLGLLVLPIMAALVTLSFFKGRYWCGNFCTHGSLFDSLLYPLSKNRKIPRFFKSPIFVIAFFVFFMANFGNGIVKVSSLNGTDMFWDRLGSIFVRSYLMVLILGGLLSLISSRSWCNFCPMGVMQRISYKFGKLLGVNKKTDKKITIASKDLCHSCGKCARVCPMQLTPYLEFSDKNQFDSDVCIRCSTCVVNCPAGILSLNNEECALKIKETTDTTGYEDRQKIKAEIEKITQIKDDIIEYTFRFKDPEKVNYKAGQFILVKIQDNPEMYRAYSISSYNEDSSRLSISIKKMKDGYGTGIIFNEFKEGNTVELEGPMGHDLIIDKSADKVVLVAGGIGITPFKAIVKDLVKHSDHIKDFKLIYGANYENEFIYDEEFLQLQEESEKFEYIKVAAFDENWTGPKGFVTDVMKGIDLEGYKIYMCGPKPMTNASIKVLKELNVSDDSINYESA